MLVEAKGYMIHRIILCIEVLCTMYGAILTTYQKLPKRKEQKHRHRYLDVEGGKGVLIEIRIIFCSTHPTRIGTSGVGKWRSQIGTPLATPSTTPHIK